MSLTNYCDIAFFDNYFRKTPAADATDSQAFAWQSFFNCGLNKNNNFVIINLSKDEAFAQIQTNPIIKKLFDLYNAKRIDLKFDKNIATQLATDNSFYTSCKPHTVFFLDIADTEIDKLEKQTGLLFFNLNNHLTKWKRYSPDSYNDIVSVRTNGEFNHWNYMTLLKHSCNSFILIDRYLFVENRNGRNVTFDYESNLKQLFQYFLPKNEPPLITDILLVCSQQDTSPNLTLTQIKNYIETQVFQPLFPNKKFNLSIVLVDKFQVPESHDRQIFTNYFNLHSGNSFTYVTNAHPQQIKPRLDTSLHIYSFFSERSLREAKVRLNDLRTIVNHATQFIGNKQNRLLT